MVASGEPPMKRLRPTFPEVMAMSKQPRLKDKVCIISGGSRGFGEAIAVRFVEEGAKVVVFSRGGCDDTVKKISQIPDLPGKVEDRVLSLKCDMCDQKSVDAMVADTVKKFGDKIDVLVNNACTFVFHSVETASPEDWDKSLGTNVKGSAMVTKAVLPHMKKAGGGSIVFQGSISSFLGQPGCATYATVKGALVQLARNCAYDFAKYNIRVNSVCAGTIETPISAVEREAHGWTYDQWEQLKVQDVMMRRVGNTREIANATLFYACNESSYCTGGHLMVDGGQTACTVMTEGN